MDGWITIGTKLDTGNLEKDLKDTKRKLQKSEKDFEELEEQKIKIEAEIEVNDKDYKEKIAKLNKKQKIEIEAVMVDGYISNSEREKIDLKYDQQRLALDKEHEKNLDIHKNKLEEVNKKMQKNIATQEKLNAQTKEISQSLSQARGYDDIKRNMNSIQNSTSNVIKKIAKWGLAIFSIRSAYSFIRQSISTLSQYNEKLGTDIEYIRYELASTLLPIIQKIVSWVSTLMAYVNYIAQTWFHFNLFQNGSVENFKKMKKSTAGALSDIKEMEKTIAGFDEITIVGEKSTSTGVGGGAEDYTPIDIEDIEISEKMKQKLDKIGKSLKTIYDILKPIIDWSISHPGTVLAILGGAGLLSMLSKVIGVVGAGGIVGTGLAGIYGLLLGIAGIGIITVSIVTITKGFLQAQKEIKKVEDQIDGLTDSITNYNKKVQEKIRTGELSDEQSEKTIDSLLRMGNQYLKTAQSTKKEVDEMNLAEKTMNILTGRYSEMTTRAKDYLKATSENITSLSEFAKEGKLNDDQMKKYIETLKKFIEYTNVGDGSVQTLMYTFGLSRKEAEELSKKIDLAKDSLYRMTGQTYEADKDLKNLNNTASKTPNKINIDVNANANQANKVINDLKKNLEGLGGSFTIGFGGSYGGGGGGGRFATGGLVLPKLASGAIINQPGRGVPLASAIGGEAGKEGIVPLTDTSAMQQLGREIGQWITVNLTNINQMNGRTISRELKTLQNDSDFAFNR